MIPVPRASPSPRPSTRREALRRPRRELERIAAALRDEGRPDDAEIVETGALMAADPLLDAAVAAAVMERGRSAAAALIEATEEHAAAIASLPDELLAARADDVRSLGRRAARIAAGTFEAAAATAMARRSSSWRRTWVPPTWPSTATSSPESPFRVEA